MTQGIRDPFELLSTIHEQVKAIQRPLPSQTDLYEWVGIGFEVMGVHCLAPLTAIREVIHFPKLTPIPYAKKWMKGVANLRGDVLPVTDIQALIQTQSSHVPPKEAKVIVINHGDELFGFLVNKIMGLKRLSVAPSETGTYQVPPILSPYIQGEVSLDDKSWFVFDLSKVPELESFYEAAEV